MSGWFTCNLGDALLAEDALGHIWTLFQSRYGHADSPPEAAVFVRHESEGRLHCEVRVYFSPATTVIARAAGAVSCRKPSSQGLALLAGSEQSWAVLFS